MSKRIGTELKSRRQARSLSLTQVELDTKIRGKYLTAIESGDYAELPNDIYSRGFVHEYASYLGLDSEVIVRRYLEERGGLAAAATSLDRLGPTNRVVVTGRLASLGLIGLVVLAVGGYLWLQVTALAAPPELMVTAPKANQTVTGSGVTVTGRTTPGADVAIDQVGVASDTDGNFTSPVTLHDGLNSIHITATSKLGKTASQTLSILAETSLGMTATTTALPTTSFAGIAVQVTVSRTVALQVAVDGKVTKQVMLAGTTQLYQGANEVKLTTSDAGATKLTLTNAVMANKEITSLGRDGETRTNQAFTPTTSLP